MLRSIHNNYHRVSWFKNGKLWYSSIVKYSSNVLYYCCKPVNIHHYPYHLIFSNDKCMKLWPVMIQMMIIKKNKLFFDIPGGWYYCNITTSFGFSITAVIFSSQVQTGFWYTCILTGGVTTNSISRRNWINWTKSLSTKLLNGGLI